MNPIFLRHACTQSLAVSHVLVPHPNNTEKGTRNRVLGGGLGAEEGKDISTACKETKKPTGELTQRIRVSFIYWPAQTHPSSCSTVLNEASMGAPRSFLGVLSVFSNSWFLETESLKMRKPGKRCRRLWLGTYLLCLG